MQILNNISRRQWNLMGFALCFSFLAYAMYTQYYGGLDPCNLCIFQRLAFIALGIVFLLAALHNPNGSGRYVYSILGLLTGAVGAAIAGRHVWIQHNPPEGLVSCGGDLSYLMDAYPITKVLSLVLEGSGDCTTIDWQFLGFSMPEASLFWFVVLTIGIFVANWRN
jgi:disulfide bond formation protein DsbB